MKTKEKKGILEFFGFSSPRKENSSKLSMIDDKKFSEKEIEVLQVQPQIKKTP